MTAEIARGDPRGGDEPGDQRGGSEPCAAAHRGVLVCEALMNTRPEARGSAPCTLPRSSTTRISSGRGTGRAHHPDARAADRILHDPERGEPIEREKVFVTAEALDPGIETMNAMLSSNATQPLTDTPRHRPRSANDTSTNAVEARGPARRKRAPRAPSLACFIGRPRRRLATPPPSAWRREAARGPETVACRESPRWR